MFIEEVENFKKKVEGEMKAFFGFAPKQVSDEIVSMRNEYMEFCDLDGDSLCDNLSPEYKEILMRYKTLLYFDTIYGELLDLEDYLKNGGIE